AGLLVIALLVTGPDERVASRARSAWVPWLRRGASLVPLAASLAIAFVLSNGFWWSPYYKVGLEPVPDHVGSWVVTVNNIGHLIIFALPDSLTLTSQFASLRLESFLFTRQSLEEARAHLTPGGVVVLYNFYRETWLLRKIAGMLETAFAQPPYVVSYGGWGRA